MSLEQRLLNGICRILYHHAYRTYIRPCSVDAVQERYLFKLLRRNKDTLYGQRYGFEDIRCYEDLAERVPIVSYEDLAPYIQEIADGQTRVLTHEKVRMFELTSGSSGGKKLIPYTRTLKKEFCRGIHPWLYDIYKKVSGVADGKSYWSITPVTSKKSHTASGIPVGFEEDAEYFGFIEQGIMRRLFAVDGSVKFVPDMQEFYRRTALQLLRCGQLALISVWNPTFLTLLCDFMRENRESLARELAKSSPKRAEDFERAVAQDRFDSVFPDLKLISCWADGSAASYIDIVRRYFPTVYIQPKGLLATECFVSFPLIGEEGARLSIRSHFFEFRRLTDGRVFTAGQLDKGEYELIVTTGGGFYRYCIGDIVEVLAVYPDAPPRIRFLRRNGICSDLFGEKLTEAFVRNVCEKLGISQAFCLLAPEKTHYCLYTTAAGITPERLDSALCESYHYHYCRQLGQLGMAEVAIVTGDPHRAYIERLAADGMRIGDIKPTFLSAKDGWADHLGRPSPTGDR